MVETAFFDIANSTNTGCIHTFICKYCLFHAKTSPHGISKQCSVWSKEQKNPTSKHPNGLRWLSSCLTVTSHALDGRQRLFLKRIMAYTGYLLIVGLSIAIFTTFQVVVSYYIDLEFDCHLEDRCAPNMYALKKALYNTTHSKVSELFLNNCDHVSLLLRSCCASSNSTDQQEQLPAAKICSSRSEKADSFEHTIPLIVLSAH
ncbi:hypothetical protein BDZ91DRAFT_560674 [Kalaharituber pfeilii]|nr:hypothetical protein BDZ91DRAFT_560674 [Kalaharituber pfeilii]